jgi:hypothetical protein
MAGAPTRESPFWRPSQTSARRMPAHPRRRIAPRDARNSAAVVAPGIHGWTAPDRRPFLKVMKEASPVARSRV